MNVTSASARTDAFFAIREAAANRMATTASTSQVRKAPPAPASSAVRMAALSAPVANKTLTIPARAVDHTIAALSTKGPVKGRLVDFIA